MSVIKRDGVREDISFDKILERIRLLSGASGTEFTRLANVDYNLIAKKVVEGVAPGITTSELDQLAADIAQPLSIMHYEYGILAARTVINNHHKNTLHALLTHFRYEDAQLTLEQVKARHFYYTARALYENRYEGVHVPLISPTLMATIARHADELEAWIDYQRDYLLDYAGFKMLESTYLIKTTLKGREGPALTVIECPQHLFMRMALGLWLPAVDWKEHFRAMQAPLLEAMKAVLLGKAPHCAELLAGREVNTAEMLQLLSNYGIDPTPFNAVLQRTGSWDALELEEYAAAELPALAREGYELTSRKYLAHATPTLFNAGTVTPQLCSCYLAMLPYDSIEGIADHWKSCAIYSKHAGGIGSSIHHIRARGSYIRGTNGHSNGIAPMLQVVERVSSYVDQGGNKRPGSHAIYLEPWHADIFDFLELKKRLGSGKKAEHLYYAIWINDEFMRCVEAQKPWYLMCPDRSPFLADRYDRKACIGWLEDEAVNEKDFAFTALYRRYVREGRYLRKVEATDLWIEICLCIMGTGVPYLLYKDACNRKSNQQNLGTIKSSNLCTEIVQFSSPLETAVCNLTSICLPALVNERAGGLDWARLQRIVSYQVRVMNRIIDINYYPTRESRQSNLLHRPIGIGVQGLADLYVMLGLPFDSEEALNVNGRLFEAIYYYALATSNELAAQQGSYASFAGSPASEGRLQFDLWREEQGEQLAIPLTLDWAALKARIKESGLRNSLLIACMPTASVSTIMGCSPCFEPYSSLIYKRQNKAGEFIMVVSSLIKVLQERGLWTDEVRNQLLRSRTASIAGIKEIPAEIRALYKTVWDIEPRAIVEQALRRGLFICQSQSMDLFIVTPTVGVLTRVQFHGWRRGIKTGAYYTRRLAPIEPQAVQVRDNAKPGAKKKGAEGDSCPVDCLSCQ